MGERRYLAVLDGLRGVAILLVVLPHLALVGLLPGLDHRLGRRNPTRARRRDLFRVVGSVSFRSSRTAAKRRGLVPTPTSISIARGASFRCTISRRWSRSWGLAVRDGRADPRAAAEPATRSARGRPLIATLIISIRRSGPLPCSCAGTAVSAAVALWFLAPRLFAADRRGCGRYITGTRAPPRHLLALFMLGIIAADLYVRSDHRMTGRCRCCRSRWWRESSATTGPSRRSVRHRPRRLDDVADDDRLAARRVLPRHRGNDDAGVRSSARLARCGWRRVVQHLSHTRASNRSRAPSDERASSRTAGRGPRRPRCLVRDRLGVYAAIEGS